MSKLEILTGRHAQHQFLVESDSIWIGSDVDCDICIPEPGISRRHARILRTDESLFWVEDAGGSFGTLLNGKSIEKEQLVPGDELTLGRTKILFSEEKTQFAAISPFLNYPLVGASSITEAVDPLAPEPSEQTNVTPAQHQATVIASLADVVEGASHEQASLDNAAERVFVLPEDAEKHWNSALSLFDESIDVPFESVDEVHMLSEEDLLEEERDASFPEEILEVDEEDIQDEDIIELSEPLEEVEDMEEITESSKVERSEDDVPIAILSKKMEGSSLEAELKRHTLTQIRSDEVRSAARNKVEALLRNDVQEVTSATRSRAELFQQEMERLKEQLLEREHHISRLHRELNEHKSEQGDTALLQTTLVLYREDNERLQAQLETYEEAALENERLLKKMLLFSQEIEDLSNENRELRRKLLQQRRVLMQHGLLRKRIEHH